MTAWLGAGREGSMGSGVGCYAAGGRRWRWRAWGHLSPTTMVPGHVGCGDGMAGGLLLPRVLVLPLCLHGVQSV